MDLTVVIPARHEEWLNLTVKSVLSAIRGNTDIVVVCDGEWPLEPLDDHPLVSIVRNAGPRGQRVAFNDVLRLSKSSFVMKLDAHCAVDEGFDQKLLAPYLDGTLGADVTTIPRMYNLHVFDWVCQSCHKRTYQGPVGDVRKGGKVVRKAVRPCPDCGSDDVIREVIWRPRLKRCTDFGYFDRQLRFQYWYDKHPHPPRDGEIEDVMSSVGACWLVHREHFLSLGGMDEAHGGWGQCGTEIACMTWLSGGRQVVNKRTWFSHLFRTQGAEFGWPYPISERDITIAREYSVAKWTSGEWTHQKRSLMWLVEKFAPVPGWQEARNEAVLEEQDVLVQSADDHSGGSGQAAGKSSPSLRGGGPADRPERNQRRAEDGHEDRPHFPGADLAVRPCVGADGRA